MLVRQRQQFHLHVHRGNGKGLIIAIALHTSVDSRPAALHNLRFLLLYYFIIINL